MAAIRLTRSFLLRQPLAHADNWPLEKSHVDSALIRKMIESDKVVLDWLSGEYHVNDCVEALVLAAERYDGPDPVNLGAAREISIR